MMSRIQHGPRQQRTFLPYKAVLIHCLDQNQHELPDAHASGFIVNEGGKVFLHTCWHVVTGYDPHHLRVQDLPKPKYLRISLQGIKRPDTSLTVMEGCQTFTIPLYDFSTTHPTPRWIQEDAEQENYFFNEIGLKVPALHDHVKIPLLTSPLTSSLQCVDIPSRLECAPVTIGDKVFVVGYPYGFSAYAGQPTAMVLTRFIAATGNDLRPNQILLDGFGARGMSGGPVFVEVDGNCVLMGLYTGTIYPDHHLVIKNKIPEVTALGSCVNMQDIWIRDSLGS